MNEECFKCLDEHEDLGLETRILVHHSGKFYVTQIDLKQEHCQEHQHPEARE